MAHNGLYRFVLLGVKFTSHDCYSSNMISRKENARSASVGDSSSEQKNMEDRKERGYGESHPSYWLGGCYSGCHILHTNDHTLLK